MIAPAIGSAMPPSGRPATVPLPRTSSARPPSLFSTALSRIGYLRLGGPAAERLDQRAQDRRQRPEREVGELAGGRVPAEGEVVGLLSFASRQRHPVRREGPDPGADHLERHLVEPVELLEGAALQVPRRYVDAVRLHVELVAVVPQQADRRDRADVDVGGAAVARQPVPDLLLGLAGDHPLRDAESEAGQDPAQDDPAHRSALSRSAPRRRSAARGRPARRTRRTRACGRTSRRSSRRRAARSARR